MNELALFAGADGGLRELALFAGAGGGILGGRLLGWRTVCAVEIEPYPASVLLARQNDGILPPFPVWDNVCTFDGRPWRGLVDVVSGGFPCQDISVAGKGAGITGERSGLWSEMARIIGEVRPQFVFVENSPALITRGLGTVLGDLAALGYDCRWTVLGAADVGAPHKRDRLWIVANSDENGRERKNVLLQPRRQKKRSSIACRGCKAASNASGNGLEGRLHVGYRKQKNCHVERGSVIGAGLPRCWQGGNPEPGILGVDDGMAGWKHRIAATGNGQVPAVAAAAWRLLTQ